MYLTLFIAAFVSATLWPMASEAVFLTYLQQNSDALLPLFTVATLGNSLGSVLMYELARQAGRFIEPHLERKRTELERWQNRLNRYGAPLLMLTWVPLVGDLLPLAAGILKTNRLLVIIYLVSGKALRYAIVSGLWIGLTG